MSSLWTPGGERPVAPRPPEPEPAAPGGGAPPPRRGAGELGPEDAERLEQLSRELLDTPAAVIVANHAMGLFELAALHLSQPEPRLEEAQVAIDAMGAIVERLGGRLGQAEATLRDAMAQLRMAYVQIKAARQAPPDPAPDPGAG